MQLENYMRQVYAAGNSNNPSKETCLEVDLAGCGMVLKAKALLIILFSFL